MKLFEKFRLRNLEFRNRIGVSPMCQYSCVEGIPNDWHLVHLGSRAIGGAGLVVAEATAVEARGRISPGDAGLYTNDQAIAWKRITQFIRDHGAVAAVQLAHAGRKASTSIPWQGNGKLEPTQGGWADVVAPSPIAFSSHYPEPRTLTVQDIQEIVQAFCRAAERALEAGFQVVEIHAAHGYLLHEFLSPLSNQRTDEYGGSFLNRIRFLQEVVVAVRGIWPAELPLFVRVSATDWVAGGWDIEECTELARNLKIWGVDLVDVSTGGNVAQAKIPVGPGYQVPYAQKIRKGAAIATAAVGLITEAQQAQTILDRDEADMIFLARELLRNPYWPREAAKILEQKIEAPLQYQRAW